MWSFSPHVLLVPTVLLLALSGKEHHLVFPSTELEGKSLVLRNEIATNFLKREIFQGRLAGSVS